MGLRVVTWGTGNVGRYAVRAVLGHPELEQVRHAGRHLQLTDPRGVLGEQFTEGGHTPLSPAAPRRGGCSHLEDAPTRAAVVGQS